MYSGERNGETFTAFRMDLQSWAGAVHDSMLKVLELADAKEGRMAEADVRSGGLNQESVDDFKELYRRLCQLLVECTKGEAKSYVSNPERSGFKAWKQVVSHIDPSTGADRSVAFSRVTHPVNMRGLASTRARTLQSARTTMQAWEQEVGEVEVKFANRIDEDATTLALKSITLETLFGEAGVFRGRSFSTYAELRA